ANRITIQVWCGTPINCNNGNEIYSFHPSGANFVMGDGAVLFISEAIDHFIYAAIGTRKGDEAVNFPE
ncbi:MAG TPA: H-X9-DG-CTERM domain-containing protein, partial [Lacipirellulaceae bacterium]|nr:H-X9-DG-CTERM domain-containing protein [Lacipirellulaceae bacterium]